MSSGKGIRLSKKVDASIRLRAKAELERRKRRRSDLIGSELLDFVPKITPRWCRPDHLAAIAAVIEEAEHREVQACISVPPQHGKTELILHMVARYLLRHPERTVAYASYSADLAHAKSKLARDYAIAAGVRLRTDTNAAAEWRTVEGGGFLATGVGGPLTGHGVQLLVIDDPHKNRQEAESGSIRQGVHDWFTSTALTRLHPGGSVLVIHTRWHEDDLIGRLSSDEDVHWDVLNLAAVNEDDTALWESHRPRAWLARQRKRVGEYDWASMYMGQPRPRGASLFSDAYLYEPEALPRALRIGIGLDLAYSAKTYADHSVVVVLGQSEGLHYVLDVIHRQCKAPEFAGELAAIARRYPSVRPRWYCAGPEQGVADLMTLQASMPIDAVSTTQDKFVRAQATAAAWNDGRILVPRSAVWAASFISEVRGFTGLGDRHDDQVDALVAAYDVLQNSLPYTGMKKIRSNRN